MELFNPAAFVSQIFWLVISFAIQYSLLSRLILPKFKIIFENRTKHINEEIALAEKLTNEANVIKKDFEAKIEQADITSMAKMNAAMEQIKRNSITHLAQLEESLARETLKQELRLEKFLSSADNELENITISTAAMLLKKIANHSLEPESLKKYLIQ